MKLGGVLFPSPRRIIPPAREYSQRFLSRLISDNIHNSLLTGGITNKWSEVLCTRQQPRRWAQEKQNNLLACGLLLTLNMDPNRQDC